MPLTIDDDNISEISTATVNSLTWETETGKYWPHGYPLGGIEYLRRHTIVAVIYIVIAVVASLVGTLGNIGVLIIIGTNRAMRNARNVFLVNLAIADLFVTAIATPFGAAGMVLGKDFFDNEPALCDFLASLCLIACVTALFSIGGISFNRYFNICHPEIYRTVFTLRNNFILCALFWTMGIAMSLPGLVGWTNNVYDHKIFECIWNRLHNLSYTIFFSAAVVATPVSIISFSFLQIYLHVRASKRRVNVGPTPGGNPEHNGDPEKQKRSDGTLKLARTLFFIFAVFVFCWSPFAILVLIDWEDRFPQEIHLFILLLAHMHSTLNPIVYAATNPHFKMGFRNIVRCFSSNEKQELKDISLAPNQAMPQ